MDVILVLVVVISGWIPPMIIAYFSYRSAKNMLKTAEEMRDCAISQGKEGRAEIIAAIPLPPRIPHIPTVEEIIAQIPKYPEIPHIPTVEEIIAQIPPYPEMPTKVELLESISKSIRGTFGTLLKGQKGVVKDLMDEEEEKIPIQEKFVSKIMNKALAWSGLND